METKHKTSDAVASRPLSYTKPKTDFLLVDEEPTALYKSALPQLLIRMDQLKPADINMLTQYGHLFIELS